MKIIKILGLVIISFILVNCDNSKTPPTTTAPEVTEDPTTRSQKIIEQSTKENINSFNQTKDNDYSKSQDLVIAAVKKQLPLVVDEVTMLVDVAKEDNVMSYKYNIKGMPKDLLATTEAQKAIRDNLISLYCGDSSEIKALKALFPDGAKHNYYIVNELVFTAYIQPSDCKAK